MTPAPVNTSPGSKIQESKLPEAKLLEAKVQILKDRALMLEEVRAFFKKLGVLEVDCPALSHAAPIDVHIEVMSVPIKEPKEIGYLHTSPEYGMKRLLALGIGDIYQMSHVFRSGEIGPLHNPEFTMVEWYRQGIAFHDFIQETLLFIKLFVGSLPHYQISYRQALKKYLNLDYLTVDTATLLTCAKDHNLHLPENSATWDKDTLLQLLVSFVIEPKIAQDKLCFLYDFPGSQAALAKTEMVGDEVVAKRFEIYYKGIELANGYHELTDAKEQRRRFEKANLQRKELGKELLPLDENFIHALEKGLPDCCGVAVGFDRLMMLRNDKSIIGDVMPFAWQDA